MEGAPRAGNAFSIVNMLFRGAETIAVPLATLFYFNKMHKHISQRKGAIRKDILT